MLNWNKEYENRFEHKHIDKILEYQGIQIDTDRIYIRPISIQDKEEISKNYTQEIARYMYYKACESLEDAENIIHKSLEWMQHWDRIVFSIFNKSNNEFLGCCGIFKLDTTTPELWFTWIKKNSQQQWYITEVATEVLKWLCLNIDFSYLYTFLDERNSIGIEIIKWLGWIVWEKLPPMESQDPTKLLYVVEYRLYRQHLINFFGI